MLVERIAALGDKAALGELDARHGLTLYAIVYTLLLDSDAADTAVAAVLRDVWREAASFTTRHTSVRQWLGDLARRAARDCLRRRALAPVTPQPRAAVERSPVVAPRAPRVRVAEWLRRAAFGLTRVARLAFLLALPVILLA
jgi:DNA-directed RNA polymerase specialized sigma24 family protein